MSKKKIWIIAAGCIAAILLTIYISGIIYLNSKFLMHTTINGIDASYCTVEEVEERIATAVNAYQIELLERNDVKEIITGNSFEYHYVSNGEVQGFMENQKTYAWPLALFGQKEFYFDHSTEFDENKLKEQVDKLTCFDPDVYEMPLNAQIRFNGKNYEIQEEQQGTKVMKIILRMALEEAIGRGDETFSLEENGCYSEPKVLSDDKTLNALAESLNHYADTSITYQFGDEEEVLDGSVIHKWLNYSSSGNVTLMENKVALYVDYLADRYDSYGKTREFQTNDGSWVSVSGGKYGWLIDREQETAELIELLHQGKKVKHRDPVYAQTAVTRENSDMGADYIEIDLTKQHLWMYLNGEVVVESDFVSGTYNVLRRRTPEGTFTLYYKKSPSVLRSNYPGDSYETPVTYWMPFNGGVGLHDATWRGSFGGEIYRNSGSHGCINLPYSAAQQIYEMIYKGIPIICFYR